MNHHQSDGGCAEFRGLAAPSRRDALQVGGLSLLGMTLPNLFRSAAGASNRHNRPPRARSCIFLFLSGGPSQYETFDPKPEARSEYRSIFGTIPSRVPGTHLIEFLPDLARQADRFALVRSAYHRFTGHYGGHRYALTGYGAPGNPDQPARTDDKPGIIALANKHLEPHNQMPATVMMPWVATDQGSGSSGGMGGGTLGRQYDPILVEADRSTIDRPGRLPVFRVPAFALQRGITPDRLANRRGLLAEIDTQRRMLDDTANREIDSFYRQAYALLTSPHVREGFDIDREGIRIRDRYGLNGFGQSCLMARRLIERGVRFVQINACRNVTQKDYGWDTHNKGRDTLKNHLLPKLNAALATLLEELSGRGLLQETLVVAMGEFGRTPRLKRDGGRDHWPQCYSLFLAGGGIQGGIAWGRSDRDGARPAEHPVEARQILVTIMELLGMPTVVTDREGRTAAVLEGAKPVREVYGGR